MVIKYRTQYKEYELDLPEEQITFLNKHDLLILWNDGKIYKGYLNDDMSFSKSKVELDYKIFSALRFKCLYEDYTPENVDNFAVYKRIYYVM